MANQIISVPDTELESIKSQLDYAKALRAKGMNTDGQMVGNIYVAKNPWANFLESAFGSGIESYNRQKQAGIEQARNQQRADFLGRMPSATTTQTYDPVNNPGTGPLVDGMEVPKSSRQFGQEMQQWGTEAMNIPGMENLGGYALQQAMTAPIRQAEAEERARARADEIAAKAAEARRLQDERLAQTFENQKFLKQMGFENAMALKQAVAAGANAGKPQLVYGEGGQAFHLYPDQSIRPIPGLVKPKSAAERKLEGEIAAKETNKVTVNDVADETLSALKDAKDAGAYITTKDNPLQSSMKWMLSTEPGKEVGRAANLDLQRKRDIADTKRTGMFLDTVKSSLSASQLNSDKELQTYMQTLGNPKSAYEAQVEAIQYIKRKYGKQLPGGAASPAPAAGPVDFSSLK